MGNVISVGTDIIECDRIEQLIEKNGDLFVQRVFTEAEILYCSGRKTFAQHYAGRWAAKESVLKVLGTGWSDGIEWKNVEVVHDALGAPKIVLTGRAAEIARSKGIREVLISISHCSAYATALATGIA